MVTEIPKSEPILDSETKTAADRTHRRLLITKGCRFIADFRGVGTGQSSGSRKSLLQYKFYATVEVQRKV